MTEDACLFSLSVLSSYADVSQALREKNLSTNSVTGEDHSGFRDAASAIVCPAKLAEWKPGIDEACVVPDVGTSVELIADIAKPWCLRIAALVTGIGQAEAERLNALAE